MPCSQFSLVSSSKAAGIFLHKCESAPEKNTAYKKKVISNSHVINIHVTLFSVCQFLGTYVCGFFFLNGDDA